MAGWFGLTIHQQSHLRGPSTAHGILASQVIGEVKIVLLWTFILESGLTTNAIVAAAGLPISFVKSLVTNFFNTSATYYDEIWTSPT